MVRSFCLYTATLAEGNDRPEPEGRKARLRTRTVLDLVRVTAMTTEQLNVAEQQEILQEICGILYAAAPAGWAKLQFTWTALVGAGTLAGIQVRGEDGSSPLMNVPQELHELCSRLKHGMYQPGKGTWLALTLQGSPDDSPKAYFNYDKEISPPHGFVPEHFRKELARYPRSPENIPAWLQEILERVPNYYMAVHGEPGDRYRGEVGPDLGEVAAAFEKAGWTVGDGEHSGELRFSTDWAALETLSRYGMVRMAGRIDPADWDRLIDFFTEQDWNFGASLYDGDEHIREATPPRPLRH